MSDDLYQCDGCGEMVPRDTIKSEMAYGCEGDFCVVCRGAEFEVEEALRAARPAPQGEVAAKRLKEASFTITTDASRLGTSEFALIDGKPFPVNASDVMVPLGTALAILSESEQERDVLARGFAAATRTIGMLADHLPDEVQLVKGDMATIKAALPLIEKESGKSVVPVPKECRCGHSVSAHSGHTYMKGHEQIEPNRCACCGCSQFTSPVASEKET
jgi:hypothetical protein